MRNLTIGTAEMDALQHLNQKGASPLRILGPQHDLELLGFVQGSYHGRVGLFTGGGNQRRYIITSAGLDFLQRIEEYERGLYPKESPKTGKAT